MHRQAETTQRELAVGSERLRQLEARREDLLGELGPLQERLHGQQQQVQTAEGAVAGEQISLQELQARIQQAQSQLDVVEAERRGRQEQIAAAQRRQAQLQNEIAAQERRLMEQDSRKRSLTRRRAAGSRAQPPPRPTKRVGAPGGRPRRRAWPSWSAQGQALSRPPQGLVEAIAQAEAELAAQASSWPACAATPTACTTSSICCSASRTRARATAAARARSCAPERGDSAQASLRGIVGTVADQLQVPAELELAIETALGGRLQDIIVERWADAERAIDWLKRSNGGRATFLPLDTLRPGQLARPAPAARRGRSGLGPGQGRPRLSKVVDYLLGRVVVTKDLPTPGGAGSATQERPTVVTLEGDIVRPGGSVSGGSVAPRRDQGVLGRERSLRELPEQLQQASDALAAQERERTEAQQRLHEQRQELAELWTRNWPPWPASSKAKTRAWPSCKARPPRWRSRCKRSQQRLAAAASEQGTPSQVGPSRRGSAWPSWRPQIERSARGSAEAEAVLAGLDTAELTADLMERRTQASVVAARLASQQTLLASQQRALAQLPGRAQRKQQRAEALAAEHKALAAAWTRCIAPTPS